MQKFTKITGTGLGKRLYRHVSNPNQIMSKFKGLIPMMSKKKKHINGKAMDPAFEEPGKGIGGTGKSKSSSKKVDVDKLFKETKSSKKTQKGGSAYEPDSEYSGRPTMEGEGKKKSTKSKKTEDLGKYFA